MHKAALGLLVLCNLIWAMNPVMGKVLVDSFSGVQVAWIRYASGFLAFLLVAVARVVFWGKQWSDYFLIPRDFRTGLELAALAMGPFVISPLFQFVGLETTQAMDNSVLVATEPLITVLLGWVVLGERMRRDHWISMAIALLGFGFFSGLLGGLYRPGPSIAFSLGMIFLLVAQFGEGAYSVFSRKLVRVHEPKAVLGSALALGALVLTLVLVVVDEVPSVDAFGRSQFAAALWLGPLGSTATYLIWAMIARTVSVASMAITLFIQPVVGAIAGTFVLGERFTLERGIGAGLILFGIAYLALREYRPFSEKNACRL